jgi:hypothetical protein
MGLLYICLYLALGDTLNERDISVALAIEGVDGVTDLHAQYLATMPSIFLREVDDFTHYLI